MSVRILRGDVRDRLRELPDESVHCVVTSPPYWGLRDYGVEGQIGLEATPDEFLSVMVDVFREVRRALRADGTAWVNMGDAYSSGGRGGNPTEETSGLQGGQASQRASMVKRYPRRAPQTGVINGTWQRSGTDGGARIAAPGFGPKQLIGMPWRLAFALQADGWWLRQDIIWAKPNPMPESVRDRCTKAHEYIFLLAKSERYYYDQEAISEPVTQDERRPTFRGGAYCNNATFDNSEGGKSTVTGNVRVKVPSGWDTKSGAHGTLHREGRTEEPEYREIKRSGNKERKPASARGVPVDTNGETNGAVAGSVPWEGTTRNKRSVWTVGTMPFPEAHFATFPPALIEPCILAGCPVGGTVLDPFGGAGTTGLVADRLQRDAILIELNPAYADMAERRIRGDAPLFAQVGT